MTTLQRLLKYPHSAVFDKAPDAELVLRVRHAGGATWSVQEEQLVAAHGGTEFTYALSDYTIQGLAAALRDDGFDVAVVSPAFAASSARILIEASGDQGESNGDALSGFTSFLWTLYSGYAVEVRDAAYAVQQALRQMVITQADGEWLDLWGVLYGDERRTGEADQDYSARIPEEAFRIRVNAFAIEDAVFAATGARITIEEPWKKLFRLSDSATLSTDFHLYDGINYGYHLIRPVAATQVDWEAILPIIERNKAAGVVVLDPFENVTAKLVSFGHSNASVSFGISDIRSVYTPRSDDGQLSETMALSDYHIKLNWPATAFHYQVISASNAEGVKGTQAMGPAYVAARASFRLSDGYALGEGNSMFPGVFADGTPIDNVDYDIRFTSVAYGVRRIWSTSLDRNKQDSMAQRVKSYGWTGNWDSRKWTNAPAMAFNITSTQRPGTS